MQSNGDISPSFVFRGLGEPIYSVTLSPNSSTNSGILWSGSESGSVDSYSLSTKRRLNKWNPHSTSVLSLNFIGDNIISQARDGMIKEWEIESGKVINCIATGSINFCRLARSKTNPNIIAVSNENKDSLSIWDVTQPNQEISKFSLPQPAGLCMALSFEMFDANEYLLSAFENGVIYCWDLKTQSVVHQIDSNWHEPIFSFAIDGNKGIFGGAHDEIIKFNFSHDSSQQTNNQFSSKITHHVSIPKVGINHVAIRKDSKIFATAGWDYRVRIFSYKKCTPLAILKCHTAGVQQLKFSEVDNLLVACSQDSSISLWNLY